MSLRFALAHVNPMVKPIAIVHPQRKFTHFIKVGPSHTVSVDSCMGVSFPCFRSMALVQNATI